MTATRFVIAGAGGATFPPRLLGDLCQSAPLAGSTVVLFDPDPVRLEVMAGLARRMVAHRDADLHIEATVERAEALAGARFVVSTFAVGGLRPWAEDNRIPFAHGIYQTVGDTVGPGGLSRALRAVPALVELAQDMERHCPDAWLFNYANPMSALIRGVARETGIKVAGLCHGIAAVERFLAGYLGVARQRLRATHVGLNHLCWITDLRLGGADAYPLLRRRAKEVAPPPEERASFLVFDAFGLYPSPAARHVAEFFPYFLTEAAHQGRDYGLELWPWDDRLRLKGEQDARLRRLAAGEEPIDPLFAPSGERAVEIIGAIVGGQPTVQFANLPNQGLVPNLPADAIVEVPAYCDASGVHGIASDPLPAGIAAVLSGRWQQIELTVAAALAGSRELALQALLADPLTPSVEVATTVLDELLAAQRPYLPRFQQGGQPS